MATPGTSSVPVLYIRMEVLGKGYTVFTSLHILRWYVHQNISSEVTLISSFLRVQKGNSALLKIIMIIL